MTDVGSIYPIQIFILQNIYWYWIFSANNWGIYVSWGVFVDPSATGLGNVHFVISIFVLDINIWGTKSKNLTFEGVCASFRGAGLENLLIVI